MINKRPLKLRRRTTRGASVIMLITLLGLMVIPLIAIFAFEVSRAVLATQMLKNATDAAALAAVATLASSDIKDPVVAQTNAKAVALNLYKQNSVLGQLLADSFIGPVKEGNPNSLQSELFFEFLDPVTKKPLPEGDPNAKVVRLTVSYGMIPAFGKFLGLSKHVIRAASHGAVPQLDVVVCFDVSGSIDDETKVTLVKREWIDDPLFETQYKDPVSSTVTHGTIRAICTPRPTGTGFNAAFPMSLASVGGNMTFSEWYANSRGTKGMRSNSVYSSKTGEAGCPPGNFSGALSYDNVPGLFTDLVVNLDGNDTFTSYTTTDGYSFPTVGTMVEAARGNLETDQLKTDSKANVPVAAKSGYQAAYFKEAMLKLAPIQDAKEAVTTFCQIINNNADAHFGLVAFDHMVGTGPGTTESRRNLDDSTPYGVNVDIPVPLIALNSASGVTKYNEVINALPPCVAKGNTNIGLAVQTAVNQIRNSGRVNAVKAIILFTDGQPTSGGPLSGDPATNARQAAAFAQQNGVPVYTIGLAINPALIPGQNAILNDTDSNVNSGGIAAISGQGAIYHQVTDSKKLRETFQKVARHLVQLVQEQYNE